jgi:hypothetical protein
LERFHGLESVLATAHEFQKRHLPNAVFEHPATQRFVINGEATEFHGAMLRFFL